MNFAPEQYVMRDQYFPRDMRTPALTAEFNQLAAYSALRLITLKVLVAQINIFLKQKNLLFPSSRAPVWWTFSFL